MKYKYPTDNSYAGSTYGAPFYEVTDPDKCTSDLIPGKLDKIIDKQDFLSLGSWIEHTIGDSLVLGDEVQQSLPVNVEFAPWY
jgi:hypothetical protein